MLKKGKMTRNSGAPTTCEIRFLCLQRVGLAGFFKIGRRQSGNWDHQTLQVCWSNHIERPQNSRVHQAITNLEQLSLTRASTTSTPDIDDEVAAEKHDDDIGEEADDAVEDAGCFGGGGRQGSGGSFRDGQ